MSCVPRIVGLVDVSSWSFDIEWDGYSPETITLDDGVYGPDELAAHVQAKIQAAGAPYDDITVSVSSTSGIVTISTSFLLPAEDITITWGASGTALRDWMRRSGATTAFTTASPSIGARAHQYGFYPQTSIVRSVHTFSPQVSQSRSDSGIVRTLRYPTLEDHELIVWYSGDYHATQTREYHDLKDLMLDHCAHGRPIRVYYDRDELVPYVEASADARGYETFVAKASGLDFSNPQEVVDGFVQLNEFRFQLHKYVSP